MNNILDHDTFFDQNLDDYLSVSSKSNKRLYEIYMDIVEQIQETSNYAEIVRLENKRKIFHIICGYIAMDNDGIKDYNKKNTLEAREYWVLIENSINQDGYKLVVLNEIEHCKTVFENYITIEDCSHIHCFGDGKIFYSTIIKFDNREQLEKAIKIAINEKMNYYL